MRKIATLSVALLGLLTGMAAAQDIADTRTVLPTGSVGDINGGAVRYRFPLSKFIATPGPLRLSDAATGTKIAIPLSSRLKVKTMTLTLTFSSSIALKPETSVMSVRFNETTLAQIRLDPKSPTVTAKVNLPVELARPGYNTLSLALSQHNGDSCEDPEAPELWTEVNTFDSALEIDGEYTANPLRLADFEQIVSPGIGGARRLAIVTPPLDKDAALLEAGALVAQAIALRSQYEPVDLRPAVLAAAPGPSDAWVQEDQIVIGTKDQILPMLQLGEADRIEGPYLGLRSLDHRQMRMVISGRTPQDVVTAARTLTYMDIPITDAVRADIKDVKVPPANHTRTLQPERIYGFEELGLATSTLTGLGTQKLTLNLPMPPDLYAPEQAALDMLLDVNYGAGMGAGSVINVDVNGKFLHGIYLGDANGAAYRGYRISIPLRDLVGGPNQIGFNVIMRAQQKDRCSGTSGRGLALTLYGTSSIQLPNASRVAAQPDLDLMVRTGFPYAEASAPTTVWVSDASLVGAGWTVLGRLAQVSGGVLPKVQFAIGGEPPRGPSILIGEAASLPPRVFANAKQALGEVNRVPYRTFNGPEGVAAPSVFARLWPLSEAPRKPDTQLPAGTVEQANDLGDNHILTAVRADGSGTATVITAATREKVLAGVRQLVSAQYWGQARGDFMLWKASTDSVVTLRLSPRYQIGSADPTMTLRFYVSQHPWLWLGGTVLVLMLLSGLTVWLLARRRSPHE